MPNERATVAKKDLSIAKIDCIIDASIVLSNSSRNVLSYCFGPLSNSMTQYMRRLEYSYIINL